MLPIPAFIVEKILPGFMYDAGLLESVCKELQYSCTPHLLDSIVEMHADLQKIDDTDLPELTGTERQIEFAREIRIRALRAEVILQKVLIGSKIVRFSLAPIVKSCDQSSTWIHNREELCRSIKCKCLITGREMKVYKIPEDPSGQFTIWQAERLNYLWQTTEPELQVFRPPAVATPQASPKHCPV